MDADQTKRYVRLTSPGWALGAMVGILGIVWLTSRSASLAAVTTALAAAVVIDGLFALRSLADLDVQVTPPIDAVAGEPLMAALTAVGVTRPVSLCGTTPSAIPDVLAVDSSAGVVHLARPARGIKQSINLDVVSTGPLGLVQAARRVRVRFALPLLVSPAGEGHDPEWPRFTAWSLAMSPTARVGDELVQGVRPYVRGDARRRVHWKASAHHRELMVGECDGLGIVLVRIVVDVPASGGGAEWAFGRAAWLGEEVLRRGWHLELVTCQPVYRPLPDTAPLAPPYSMALTADRAVSYGGSNEVAQQVVSHQEVRSVTNLTQLRRTLATATPGPVDHRLDGVMTRVISSGSDEWR